MQDGVFDDLLDAGVRDWGGGVDGVVGAALLDGVEEGEGGGHSNGGRALWWGGEGGK